MSEITIELATQCLTRDCTKVFEQAVTDLQGTERPGQLAMAGAVQQALSTGEKLMVQAGTGTGKSLGYLIPALLHALETKSTVVISTATLALQNQIITKDAPLAIAALQKALGKTARVEVLKGWSNYVCLHRLNGGYVGADEGMFSLVDATQRADFLAGNRPERHRVEGSFSEQTKRLYAWANKTQTGDQDEAPRSVGARAWRQVSISSRECLGETCGFRKECFQVQAREKAALAQVVVTNHAMIGIAAAGRMTPLPDFDCLIIDEAHDLVDRVRSQSSAQLSGEIMMAAAGIAQRLSLQGASDLQLQALEVQAALLEMPDCRYEEVPSRLGRARELALTALRAALRSLAEKNEAATGSKADQIALAKGTLQDLTDTLETLQPSEVVEGRMVLWVSRGREGDEEPRLYTAPLDVANRLAHNLFAERAIVATSATLKLGGVFDHILRDVGFGFSDTPVRTLDVGTPFDPASQGILYVAADLPAPGRDIHPQEFWDRLVELAEASGGGLLGLFSSRRMADYAAEVLRVRTDFPILVQGEGTIASLVQEMREDSNACLLGTLSLWQGVDLPGQTCRLVVIDRIPFPVPSDPLVEARCAAVKRRGGSDFMEVSLTHAALLLAQGSGRLLRSSDDRGVVAILDSRLRTARYGRFLRDSMLPMWPTEDIEVVRGALQRLRSS